MTRPCVSAIVTVLFLTSSCLRYVPSREEISHGEKQGMEERVAGPEQFWAWERGLSARLSQLIKSRANLIRSEEADSYRVGQGDVIELEVYGLTDLNSVEAIESDGTLMLPLAGPIAARGKTLVEIREAATTALSAYVRNPKLRLSIKEYGGNKVSVIGAVARPGTYPLKRRGATVTELLSQAGGRSERASSRIILIPALTTASFLSPGIDTSTMGYGVEIDVSDLNGTIRKKPLVIPVVSGDTIVVPEMGTFRVDGEVNRGGSFPLAGQTSALGAVAAAGGFTYSANVNQVEVVRELGNGEKASVVLDLEKVALNQSQDIPLRDGDLVRVPSEPGRFRTRQMVEVLNGLFRASVSSSVKY